MEPVTWTKSRSTSCCAPNAIGFWPIDSSRELVHIRGVPMRMPEAISAIAVENWWMPRSWLNHGAVCVDRRLSWWSRISSLLICRRCVLDLDESEEELFEIFFKIHLTRLNRSCVNGLQPSRKVGRIMLVLLRKHGWRRVCVPDALLAIWNGAFRYHIRVTNRKCFMSGLTRRSDTFLLRLVIPKNGSNGGPQLTRMWR